MLGLGFWEIVLIAVIALLVVGPDQLPTLARNLARFINELKRSTDDFKREINNEEFVSSSQIEESNSTDKAKELSSTLGSEAQQVESLAETQASADIQSKD